MTLFYVLTDYTYDAIGNLNCELEQISRLPMIGWVLICVWLAG